MKQYDIVIIGAGMTGATLALAVHQLCEGNLSIAVIEANRMEENKAHPGFDSRAIALSFGTANILKRLNLWSDFLPLLTPITDIEVSDKGHLGLADIKASTQGVDALGYVVELESVGRLYQDKLTQCPAVDYLCPSQVKHINRTMKQVEITLENGSRLMTKLMVAADGALSESCQQLNIPLKEMDFEQFAIIANVSTNQSPEGRAFERFTSSGPLAFLRMLEGRSSVVWCMSEQKANQLMGADESTVIEQLQHDFGWRLGKITKVGARACYPFVIALSRIDRITSHCSYRECGANLTPDCRPRL